MIENKRYILESDIPVAFDRFLASVNSIKSKETETRWNDAIQVVKTFIIVLSMYVKE